MTTTWTPPPMHLFISIIRLHLQQHLYDNAIFLSHRLCAAYPSDPEAQFYLAKAHYANHESKIAYHILMGNPLPQAKHLLAQCCLQLDKLQEAHTVLTGLLSQIQLQQQNLEDGAQEPLPDESTIHYLLGIVCKRQHFTEPAIKHLRDALSLNPFLSTASEALSQLGVMHQDDVYFNVAAAQSFLRKHNLSSSATLPSSSLKGGFTEPVAPAMDVDQEQQFALDASNQNIPINHKIVPDLLAPRPPVVEARATKSRTQTAAPEPPRTLRKPHLPLAKSSGDVAKSTTTTTTRRSERSVSSSGKRELAPSAGPDKKRPRNVPPTSGNGPILSKPSRSQSMDPFITNLESESFAVPTEVLASFLHLLQVCSNGVMYLTGAYMIPQSIKEFQKLPYDQFESTWVWSQLARAHFELGDYDTSAQYYERIRAREPYRMEGMDVYSVVLWHQKKDVALSYLGHDLLGYDKQSATAWCAVGNTFSLKQEHDLALSCFQRAAQLNPHLPYPYTLAGHEYVANEDLEKAQTSFRSALRVDPRHYNAWYGLANLYTRQEKFDLAEIHFRRAIDINPSNSILIALLANVLVHKKRLPEAHALLVQAATLSDPPTPLIRFRIAQVLLLLDRPTEALAILTKLKASGAARTESNVHFLIGQVYKRLGDVTNAVKAWTVAMDFVHPAMAMQIKDAIGKLHKTDQESNASELFKIFESA